MGVSIKWFVVIGFFYWHLFLTKKKLIIWQKVSKSVIVVQQKLVAYSHRKVLCLNRLLLDA